MLTVLAVLSLSGCVERSFDCQKAIVPLNADDPFGDHPSVDDYLAAFDGMTLAVDSPDPWPTWHIALEPDASSTTRIDYRASCGGGSMYQAWVPLTATSSSGSVNEGRLNALPTADAALTAATWWQAWSPSPDELAWIVATAEEALGGLPGPFVEAHLHADYEGGTLHLTTHFEDPADETGVRQVQPAEVPAFIRPFTLSP